MSAPGNVRRSGHRVRVARRVLQRKMRARWGRANVPQLLRADGGRMQEGRGVLLARLHERRVRSGRVRRGGYGLREGRGLLLQQV